MPHLSCIVTPNHICYNSLCQPFHKHKEGFIPIAKNWEDTTRTKPSFKDYYIEKELSEKHLKCLFVMELSRI